MKNKIFLVVGMLFIVLVLIYVVSLTNTNQTSTEGIKVKEAPKAYINKEKPTAIFIQGNPEPVLRIEDLPKEFPAHIEHLEGARFPDTRFGVAAISPNAQRIAFSCGAGHTWVGIFELSSKKVLVFTWLFETTIDQILWSPNSKYFTYTLYAPSGALVVGIVGLKERTAEPYLTNHWSLGIDKSVLITNLRWIDNGESLQFEIQRSEIRNNEIVKVENEPAKTITLKAVKETEEEVKEPPKKVKGKGK
ncbi:MAG: hypothetical protein A2145_01085 [candidate division Zixibacteria bacterium RBG_16_40_9]|nr:MAG: hypothetical protein A2145_01085 [candidate division Zixibacteria bacterium RBG_16_40_9]